MTIEFDGQNNKLGTTTANSVVIKTNDTDAITIDSSQNTTLAGNIDVSGNASADIINVYNASAQGRLNVSNNGAEQLEVFPGDVSNKVTLQAFNRSTVASNSFRYLASTHEFTTGGSERMRIDSSGNVGIGTSSPTRLLTIADTGGTYMSFDDSAREFLIGSESNQFIFYDQNSSAYRMAISQTGNVVIGSNTVDTSGIGGTFTALNMRAGSGYPVVYGQTTATATNSASMQIVGATSGASAGGGAELLGVIQIACESDSSTNATGYMNFFTGSGGGVSEKMRITSDGNVGIGTTSPGKLLEVQGPSNETTAVFLVENNNSSTYNSVVSEIRGGRATTNGSYYLFQGTNGNSSGVFRVLDSGNAQNTNNSYGGTSDLKLKENIVDANSQWEDIKALPIKKYSFKLENSETPTQIGVIAQDLETEGMNGLVEETIDRDEDGNDLGTTTKSVKYSVLYMKAVKALQEALTEIDNLKARVDTLEGN